MTLGWSLGCKGWLLAALGIQGILFRPMWTHFLLGRYNLVFSSLIVLSMGLFLSSQRLNLAKEKNPTYIRYLSLLLFVPIALWGFLLYPPFVLILLPFAFFILVRSIHINKSSLLKVVFLLCISIFCILLEAFKKLSR